MEASDVTDTIAELEAEHEEPAAKAKPAKPKRTSAPKGAAAREADHDAEPDEHHEHDEHHERHDHAINRTWVAVFISILAVALAITSTGGGNSTKDMMTANIIATDTFAFYQAKAIRQTSTKLAADELLALRSTSLWLPTEAAAFIDQRLQAYQAAIAKYESEPETGEGKTELLAKAREQVLIRDRAAKQDPYFDYGEALLQIAIVLASVSIVVRRRWVLWLSYTFATLGVLLTIDAFTLLVDLPI